MARATPIRFQYEPETTFRETEQMRAIEELAYRRVLDLIVMCGNKVIDDDAEMGRMTKTGDMWPEIKARLVKNHGLLYVLDGYIRNVRYDAICTAVERSTKNKSRAGKASATAKRVRKNAAPAQPPRPEPTPPRQVLPDPLPVTGVKPSPPTNATPGPVPSATPVEVDPPAGAPPPDSMAPVREDGNGDGRPIPEQEATTIPQDWRPDPEGIRFAQERGYTETQIGLLIGGYVASHDQRGDTSKNWNPGFKMWVLRALNPTGPAYLPPTGSPVGHEAEHRPG